MKGFAIGIPRDALAEWDRLQFGLGDAAERKLRVPCRAGDAEVWDGATAEDVEYAVAQCRTCPVLGLCGAYAKAAREKSGVWAGKDRNPRPVAVPERDQPELFNIQSDEGRTA